MPGTWVGKRWWKQEVLDLAGARVEAMAEEDEGGGGVSGGIEI